jgi:hypothetical protein
MTVARRDGRRDQVAVEESCVIRGGRSRRREPQALDMNGPPNHALHPRLT